MPAARRQMPKWTKAPEPLIELFSRRLETIPDASVRKMFGYPAAFSSGQMFAGLFQTEMFLRLSDHDRSDFLSQEGARPFEPMAGRPMREYVVVPERIVQSTSALDPWLRKARDFAASLASKRDKAPTPSRSASARTGGPGAPKAPSGGKAPAGRRMKR